MGVITAVEDDLIDTTQALFGQTLKRVDSVPGQVSLAVLKQMISASPSVYFGFLGGIASKGNEAYVNGRFTAYITSRNAGGQTARRRGTKNEIGIYDIVERLVPEIHGHTVPDIGTLNLIRVDNLFSLQLEQNLGAALWAAVFELPRMEMALDTNPSSIDDFITFHNDWDLDPDQNGDPIATDNVTLPQE